MSNTKQTPVAKASFTVGQTVSVWEPKGCRELKGGPSSSERTGGEYEDIMPEEKLVVVKKLGSTRAIVRREDGMEISMHLNHINPDSSYYALRGQKSQSQKPIAQRIAEAQAKLAKEAQELKELMALQAETETEAEETEGVEDSAREEAKALFNA